MTLEEKIGEILWDWYITEEDHRCSIEELTEKVAWAARDDFDNRRIES